MARATHGTVCPCGGRPAGSPYRACCGRYTEHLADTPAPDAQALMRSRYTAFVRGDAAYLQATWHASTRPLEVSPDEKTRWLGLAIKRHEPTGDDRALVEFVARYRIAGRAQRLHEVSRFVHEDGRWYYVDGQVDDDADPHR